MNELMLLDTILTAVTSYGPAIFALALLIGALGVPLPGTVLVLAAGALTYQGLLEWPLLLLWGLAGVVLGDIAVYGLGRFAQNQVQGRYGRTAVWQSAQETFSQHGGAAVYLTRFLITPLAVPTNLIASAHVGLRRFLFYDVAGELTWLLLYGGLGYVFSSQQALISQIAGNVVASLVAIILLVAAVRLGGIIFRSRGWQILTPSASPV